MEPPVAEEFADLSILVKQVMRTHSSARLECFVRSGSRLDGLLQESGFVVPDFFKSIGPLVEWRKGDLQDVGISEKVQCLAWF